MRNPGIYEIVNVVNGKRYVGQSIDLERRCRNHFIQLNKGNHYNDYLQYSFNKYSELAFYFRVLEYLPEVRVMPKDRARAFLTEREQYHFEKTSRGMSYQIQPAAGSNLGMKFSSEIRAKVAASKTGRKFPLLSAAKRGFKFSAEAKAKMSAARKRYVSRPEARIKIAETARVTCMRRKESGTLTMSQEARAKISAAHMGKKYSPETIKRMAKGQRARQERNRAEKLARDGQPQQLAMQL